MERAKEFAALHPSCCHRYTHCRSDRLPHTSIRYAGQTQDRALRVRTVPEREYSLRRCASSLGKWLPSQQNPCTRSYLDRRLILRAEIHSEGKWSRERRGRRSPSSDSPTESTRRTAKTGSQIN